MKILTFNWHEGYIHLMAKLGYQFDVIEKKKGGRFGWMTEFRPVPRNCCLISEAEASIKLNGMVYDRVIAHNFNDLSQVYQYRKPIVLICHNKLSCELALGNNAVDRKTYLKEIVMPLLDATTKLTLVFISKAKMDDWGLSGEIILPGIDPCDYGGYAGHEKKVLRIGNLLKMRDIMLGYRLQEKLLQGLSSTILGLNPGLPGSILPESWYDFKNYLKGYRCYLNTTLDPYEDGYNLAMLEAMATGMPVVSIENNSSPIVDGVTGYISKNEEYLREKIQELLSDIVLGKRIGERGREMVTETFSIGAFLRRWKTVLGES